MPVYVYETVEESGAPAQRFERLEAMGSEPLTHHPETGAPVRRVIAQVARYSAYSGIASSVERAAEGGGLDAPRVSSCCAGGSCAHRGAS